MVKSSANGRFPLFLSHRVAVDAVSVKRIVFSLTSVLLSAFRRVPPPREITVPAVMPEIVSTRILCSIFRKSVSP